MVCGAAIHMDIFECIHFTRCEVGGAEASLPSCLVEQIPGGSLHTVNVAPGPGPDFSGILPLPPILLDGGVLNLAQVVLTWKQEPPNPSPPTHFHKATKDQEHMERRLC